MVFSGIPMSMLYSCTPLKFLNENINYVPALWFRVQWVGWLTDWLASWLACWLAAGSLVEWPTTWLAGCLAG